MLHLLRDKGIKNRLTHPRDFWWDLRLGIRTFGYLPAVGRFADHDWRGHYEPTPYKDLFQLLARIDLRQDDVFVDLGCGLGRAVFAAHHLAGCVARGVEIDPGLCALAELNRLRAGGTFQGVSFRQAGADQFDPSGCTVLFVYNAFGFGTLKTVLERVRADLLRAPRNFRLIYFNPVFDHLLAESGFLTQVDHWDKPRLIHPASFWRSGEVSS